MPCVRNFIHQCIYNVKFVNVITMQMYFLSFYLEEGCFFSNPSSFTWMIRFVQEIIHQSPNEDYGSWHDLDGWDVRWILRWCYSSLKHTTQKQIKIVLLKMPSCLMYNEVFIQMYAVNLLQTSNIKLKWK